MKKIVIIGNGISGVTAARHIRKQTNFPIHIISSESKYFWSRTALMYIYMGHMKFEHTQPYPKNFWKKNNIHLIHDYVKGINIAPKNELILQSNDIIEYDILILATGSKPKKFGWEGENSIGVSGMVSLQDLENIEIWTKNIQHGVIVGGGLIGIELAEMLLSRKIEVTMLIKENSFWNNVLPYKSSYFIQNHIEEHGLNLKTSTELEKIITDKNNKVKKIITKKGENIDCQFVGITAGVHPNIELTKSSGIKCNKGILVDDYLTTNIPNIYAIGDCAENITPKNGRTTIEQTWYTGRMMGETVAKTICGRPTKYNPGNWFNSAKFFDIEYQTYGKVSNLLSQEESEIYWEHKTKKIALHIVFNKINNQFLGVNSFGIRLRHEVVDEWLRKKSNIYEVLENLDKANFNPEFSYKYEIDMIKEFNKQHPNKVIVSKKNIQPKGFFTNLFN